MPSKKFGIYTQIKKIQNKFMQSNDNSISDSSKNNFDKKKLKNKIRSLNPNIFHFTIQSNFIYEPTQSFFYYNKLSNSNKMKISNEEINKITNFYNQNFSNNSNNFFYVFPSFKLFMESVQKTIPILNKRDNIIKNLILSSPLNYNISVAKITQKFNEIAEKENLNKIHKSTMHKIFRKKLLLNFKKRTIKNEKLKKHSFIKFSFFFMKIMFRSLNLGLKPIFIDESGFSLKNNNFKTWVFNNEQIYYGSNSSYKFNLIIATSNEKIFHFQINKESTNGNIFQHFMEELVEKLKDEKKEQDYLIVMDNFSGHLTPELFKFYNNNKLKILFGVPYASEYNMAEYVFRSIKNIIYKKLYNSADIFREDIKNILKNNINSSLLNKLFFETIRVYLKFIEEYKSYNLNN